MCPVACPCSCTRRDDGTEWDRASIRELVQRTLAPFAKERFAIDGPEALIAGNGALHLTMALHELATNAVKYGALSNQDGKVTITWSIAGDRVELTWQERGGPPVVAPTRKGFGSVMVEQATDGQAELTFPPEGVRCTLNVSSKSKANWPAPCSSQSCEEIMTERRVVNINELQLADTGNGDQFVAQIGRAGPQIGSTSIPFETLTDRWLKYFLADGIVPHIEMDRVSTAELTQPYMGETNVLDRSSRSPFGRPLRHDRCWHLAESFGNATTSTAILGYSRHAERVHAMPALVTGFGCRPITDARRAHTGAGVRKPPGKEGAGVGAPGSAGAMGIWLAPSVQRGPVKRAGAAADEH